MAVYLKSNLDDFNRFEWPKEFSRSPCVGEIIRAKPYKQAVYYVCKESGLSLMVEQDRVMELAVCGVTHMVTGDTLLELHFKQYGGYNMDWWEKMKSSYTEYITLPKEDFDAFRKRMEK